MAVSLHVKRGRLTWLQMHRHGSRGPAATEEEDLLNSLVQTLREGHSAIYHARLPENLHFLKNDMIYSFNQKI
jgi:hypothetical protein